MTYVQGEPRPYIPVADGNRTKPINEQVEVEIITPTESTRRKIAKAMAVGAGDLVGLMITAREGTPEHDRALEQLSARMLDSTDWQEVVCRLCVRAVRLRGGGVLEHRGRKVTTGGELAEFGPGRLMSEVASEAYGEYSLTEEEKKSSSEPSASSARTPAPSTGTAAPVAPAESTSSEAATSAAPPAPAGSS